MTPKKQQPAKRPSEFFAQRMAESRAARRLTQAQLAERVTALGVPTSRETIARTETQARGLLLDDAFAYAAALGPSPTDFFTPWRINEPVALAPGLIRPAREVRQWIRGQGYLDADDRQAVSDARPEEDVIRDAKTATSMIVRLAQQLVDAVVDEDRERAADVVDNLNSALDIQRRTLKKAGL